MPTNRDKLERARRAEALDAAPAEFERRGIPFKRKHGARFEVPLKGFSAIDFYPSTGKWRVRESNTAGTGWNSLEAYYKKYMENA